MTSVSFRNPRLPTGPVRFGPPLRAVTDLWYSVFPPSTLGFLLAHALPDRQNCEPSAQSTRKILTLTIPHIEMCLKTWRQRITDLTLQESPWLQYPVEVQYVSGLAKLFPLGRRADVDGDVHEPDSIANPLFDGL